MKNVIAKLMIAAAALAVATSAASAAVMKADIPFAFRAGNKVLPAGEYRVEVNTGSSVVFLRNIQTKDGALLLAPSMGTADKEWLAKGYPMMAFDCGAGRCALARLWSGAGYPTYNILHHKLGGPEQASLTLIRLVRGNGD